MAHPKSPSPYDVRTALMKSGLTIEEAAFCVYHPRSAFVRWLKDVDHPDHSPMPPECAELFALKTGLKPLPEILGKLGKNARSEE